MEESDADCTPLATLGVNGALREKLLVAQVYTAGQLAIWLRGRSYRPIAGIGRDQVAKLSDLLVTHQIKRQTAKAE